MTITFKYIFCDQNIYFSTKLYIANQKKAFYCGFVTKKALPKLYFLSNFNFLHSIFLIKIYFLYYLNVNLLINK